MKKYLIPSILIVILMTTANPVIGSFIAGMLVGALIHKMSINV